MATELTEAGVELTLDPYAIDPALGLDLDRRWTEREYLAIEGARGLEFVTGTLEVLPMPTVAHQLMLRMLFRLLDGYVESRKLGFVLFAGVRVRTLDGRYREPDLAFLKAEFAESMKDLFWERADLVMEVVSDDDRRRDLHTKRREYARAGIAEYWIIDPRQESITVLSLSKPGEPYSVHGTFRRGQHATSICLAGFEVDVAEVLDQSPDKLRGTT